MRVGGMEGAQASACGAPGGEGFSREAHKVGRLLSDFASGVRGLQDVVVVSSDGLLLAGCEGGRRGKDLAAVVSGLVSLSAGASRALGSGAVKQTIVTMEGGHLFLMSISDGSCLGVHAALDCDLGVVAYQMALFVERAGYALTPEVRGELQRAMAAR
jgi:uncharacterized protein